jgi:uncharacterized membrane protein YfcA
VGPLPVLAALAVGGSLGLVGAGGSVLAVPILVGLGVPAKSAIAEGLAVVALIAAAGALVAWQRGGVVGAAVLRFAPAVVVGSALGAQAARFAPARLQLGLFALAALAAAWRMGRGCPWCDAETPPSQAAWPQLAAAGFAVGLLTGFVGVGGGFLIVPALVLLAGVPMRLATGSSLVVVAIAAAVAFVGHAAQLAGTPGAPDPDRIALLGGLGAVGAIAGERAGRHLRPDRLRRLFAALLVGVAAWLVLTAVRA